MSEHPMSALAIAERFLREELADGPRHGAELVDGAKARGISPSTLAAAKRSIKVVSRRESWGAKHSGNGRWVWVLPRAEADRRSQLVERLQARSEAPFVTAEERERLKLLADRIARENLERRARLLSECPVCKKAFTPKRKNQMYCSRPCQQKGKRG